MDRDITAFCARMPSHPHWTRRAALAAMLGLASSAAWGNDGWTLRHVDDAAGIQVWLEQNPGPYPRFRARMTLPHTRLASAVALLRDAASMPRWVYATKSAHHLSGGGGATGVSRVINELPGPLSDRESVVQWAWSVDATGRVVTLSGQPATAPPEPLPNTVRMPGFASSWTLRALAGAGAGAGAEQDGVDIEFEGWANPGGNLALPFMRRLVAESVWQAPLNTLLGMQKMMSLEPYRSAVLPVFLRVP